ncbi:MAG: hypothetical protein LBC78_03525 [Oscillospiraceae bacterium]|jgi:hypothetical protein|nr:hypothetical protein [Oscillospiraceae bacterium]
MLYIAIPASAAESSVLPDVFIPASMIYRTRGARLCRAQGQQSARGGIMILGAEELTGGAPLSLLISELITEMRDRGYSGVLINPGRESNSLHRHLVAGLVAAARGKITVFVTEALAGASPDTVVLIQTALSGGSLYRHLHKAVSKYGAPRCALEIDRISMSFPLPCRGGAGETLPADRLRELVARRRVFFSDSLCVNYFSYIQDGQRHMALYDDAKSIREKLFVAKSLGISGGFLFYPHVRAILSDLASAL